MHRSSTPLELFFDLTFVVAVAQSADGLEQGLASSQIRHVLIGYPLVFFARHPARPCRSQHRRQPQRRCEKHRLNGSRP